METSSHVRAAGPPVTPIFLLVNNIVLRIVSLFYNNGFLNIFFTQIELKGSGVYGAKGGYLQAGGPAAEAQK